MASTVVHIFLQNMKKVMRSHSFACFKETNKDQLQYLYNEILDLSKFIYKVEEKRVEHLELKNLVVQVRDVVLVKCTNTGLYSHRSSDIVQLTLPASLKRLTLQKTNLKWKEISVLGELESLEVLKLLEDACIVCDDESEEDWDTSGQEFSQLKYLKMRRLDIMKWDDPELGFQCLEVLVLDECRRLELLPLGLAQVPTLRMIEVTRCNPSAETSARNVVEEHIQQCGDENLRALIIS